SICPPVPTPTVTRLAIACRGACAKKFRFDAIGMVTPAGKTVRKLEAVACAAVTFRTTALAVVGTPVVPPTTVTGAVTPAPIGVPIVSEPKARLGLSGLLRPLVVTGRGA